MLSTNNSSFSEFAEGGPCYNRGSASVVDLYLGKLVCIHPQEYELDKM